MKFSQTSVSTRLTIGFGVVMATLVAVVVVGIVKLGMLNDIITSDVDFGTAEISELARANGKAQGAIIGLQRMVISTDLTYRANEQKLLEQRMVAYQAAMDKLGQLLKGDPTTNEKERKLLTDTSALARTVTELQEKVIKLALANDPTVGNILAVDVAPKVQQWTNLLGDFRDYKVDKSVKAAKLAHENYAAARNILLIVGAAGLLLSIALAIAIARSIQSQLGGEPTYAAKVAHQISEGNLISDIYVRSGDTTSLLATMKTMRDALAKVVFEVRQGSEGVSTASAEIAAGNHDLSARTESQASALEQTAASMEQLNATVKQNAEGARQADQLAKNASVIAVQGGKWLPKL